MSAFRPLFVFGIARSGTNLVAGMLNARSDTQLALDPLMPFFKAVRGALLARNGDSLLAERYSDATPFQDNYFNEAGCRLLDAILVGDLDIPLRAAEAASLATSVAARAALESTALSRCLAASGGATFAALLHDILARIAAQSGKSLAWCGAKEVWTTDFIPLLARAMPDSRFIVIRRDPRAIIASLIAMMRSDRTQAAHVISYMRHWRKEAALVAFMAAQPSLADRLLVVRYEALASEPQPNAARLCDFLGVRHDSSMLSPVGPDGVSSHGNSSYGSIEHIATTSIARWQRSLDAAVVKTIECHCGPEMLAEGLELVASPPIWPDAAVARIVAEADREPGGWRSDSGDPQADLAHETRRWTMLEDDGGTYPEAEIRAHFLFTSFFMKLRDGCRANTPVALTRAG